MFDEGPREPLAMVRTPDYDRSPLPRRVEDIGSTVISASVNVHRRLGPGLMERVYQVCLAHELQRSGLSIEQEVALPVEYDGIELDAGYRLDLVVSEEVILELKAVESLLAVHEAQLLTYLKLSGKRLGYLINFNAPRLVDGLKRMVL